MPLVSPSGVRERVDREKEGKEKAEVEKEEGELGGGSSGKSGVAVSFSDGESGKAMRAAAEDGSLSLSIDERTPGGGGEAYVVVADPRCWREERGRFCMVNDSSFSSY